MQSIIHRDRIPGNHHRVYKLCYVNIQLSKLLIASGIDHCSQWVHFLVLPFIKVLGILCFLMMSQLSY